MHASVIDFVTALSAEERCPVCGEPHAAIDQRACVACHARVCADCAHIRPDAAWMCARCAPPPAPKKALLRFPPRLRGLTTRLQRVAFADALDAALRQVVHDLARVHAQLSGAAERSLRPAVVRVRAAVAFHVAGLLIATAILTAVARADTPRPLR